MVSVEATTGTAAHARIELLHGAEPHVPASARSGCLCHSLVLQAPNAGRLTSAPVVGAASHRGKAIEGAPDLGILVSLRTPASICHEKVAAGTEATGLDTVLTVALRGLPVLVRIPPVLVPVRMRIQPLPSVVAVLSAVETLIIDPSPVICPVKPACVTVPPGCEVKSIALVTMGTRRGAMLQIVVWQGLDGLASASLTWNALPGSNLRLV